MLMSMSLVAAFFRYLSAFCLLVVLVVSENTLNAQASLPRNVRGETPFLTSAPAVPEELIFAVREDGKDHKWGHWYANFGYYCLDPSYKNYGKGGRLCKLSLSDKKLTVLVDDPEGTVRDPQLHYDGRKILFSWRKGGAEDFHLWEINIDGSGLRQLTDGPYADIEPCYLPDGGIAFVSSRCNRWVNCWQVPVATLYRCDGDGKNIRQLSANIEHDNTPWVLPDGRILFTRWEYIDRSQTHYHHLWTMNPDGTKQMVYYGNLRPGNVFISAKPVPGGEKVMMIRSPRHGLNEHSGSVALVDVSSGPDDPGGMRDISGKGSFRDPYPLAEGKFLVATGRRVLLGDGKGGMKTLYTLPEEFAGVHLQEPRPLVSRKRERVIPPAVNLNKTTGTLFLFDIYNGRNMKGVKKGEIRNLLVLEALPKPVQFTGSMEPLTWGGSFTLERIVGTVPVEEDGSAYMELPANRSFFFVALDEKEASVKRMQSFLTVMPGEVGSCLGCHENRNNTSTGFLNAPLASKRRPSVPRPVPGMPDVFDFPRDVQPVLDRHCIECHSPDRYEGGVLLTGDRGPIYSHAYFTLKARGEIVMGRNLPKSNYAPRTIGDTASPLMKKLDGSHYGVRPPPRRMCGRSDTGSTAGRSIPAPMQRWGRDRSV